jgi:hypothetical protein
VKIFPTSYRVDESSLSQPQVKVCAHFGFMNAIVHNLGDGLAPFILNRLGFECVAPYRDCRTAINNGRCLTTVGTVLTSESLRHFQLLEQPLDVWGSGWGGRDESMFDRSHIRYYAVRGPDTDAGLEARCGVWGDPALLLPYLFPRQVTPGGKTLLVPHINRVASAQARKRTAESGCDEVLSTHVWAPLNRSSLWNFRASGILRNCYFWRKYRALGVRQIWEVVDRIAGASFVLAGSLHSAILAQSYGVPWAPYNDGYVNMPPKWEDWCAYLGIRPAYVRTLSEGRQWWVDVGARGRIRSLRKLLAAFPYIDASRNARYFLPKLPD